jgi:hypothetical protein
MRKARIVTYTAIGLIIFSGILFGLIFLVPFLPLTLGQKGIAVTTLIIGMEVTWWVGVALVGKQIIQKYIKWLNPFSWFKRKTV